MREAEKLAESQPDGSRGMNSKGAQKPKEPAEKPADTRAMEKAIAERLGLQVSINHKKGEAGDVVVRYKTLEQLELIYQRLRRD